ncbi:hypothetical protein GHK86_02240 [Acidimicrobiaceae bacterium USS-CC1]|uniref:Type II toxin-antitoxin system RelE/ParE family toxin n=1 Tax=Acidiferrimicrobium australe TaxID=2664430 RepID=A0ABW9QPW6_9ACTN|nr:hypothetical protein [Acidiferrimicrobium australe]
MATALAVWEFCDGPFREPTGEFSARRGAYRAIYRLVRDDSAVHVVRLEHPADVDRRR